MITPEQLTVTEDLFFQTLPAFADEANAPYTFRAMQPFLTEAAARIADTLSPATDLHDGEERQALYYAQAFVCYCAAFTAVPQLDLVFTPNGFGVVSNQHVAPASRDRVDALLHSLETGRDEFYTRLVEFLRNQSAAWCASAVAHRVYSSLVSLPADASASGIYDEHTRQPPANFRELTPFRARIGEAESVLANFISEELLAAVIERQLTPHAQRYTRENTPYTILLNRCRIFVACYCAHPGDPALRGIGLKIAAYAQQKGVEEYLNSSLVQAARGEHYENRKNDTLFFFN